MQNSQSVIGTLASQVKPRFIAPAAAAAIFGALLAPRLDLRIGAVHLLATMLALYVAHLRDERLDAHVRREEEPMVAETLLRYAIPTANGFFLVAWGMLFVLSGRLPAVLALVPWLLGLLHAPYLDSNPVTTSLDYPVAVAAVIAGGYAAQTGQVPGWLLWIVSAFVLMLAGAAISLDRSDREFDTRIDKRTIPVVLGDQQSAAVSAGLVAASGVVLLVGALIGPLPLTVALATPFLAVAAVASRTARPHYAIRVQMIAAYPFGSALFAATCLGTNCVLARTIEMWV